MIKRREGCKSESYPCEYFCLSDDKTKRIVGLATCRNHSGIEQYIQDSHPFYYRENKSSVMWNE